MARDGSNESDPKTLGWQQPWDKGFVVALDTKTGKVRKNTGEGVVPSVVLSQDLAFVASGWGGRESIKAFKLGARGELIESNMAWEQKKGMPRVPSFLFVKPFLFIIGDSGMAMCLRAETGEIVWQERLGGNFSASPVATEGRIFLTADSGDTTIIEAGPKLRVLASNPINERVQASLALSGGRLYLRAAQNLYCIGKK
jgi:outer membrane protein assembly factor BamB